MGKKTPEKAARKVVDACADCDICRSLMDSTCLLFPELYRLYDQEMETGKKIAPEELRRLVDLCNFCAVCPCPNIRADIMTAKTAFIDKDGLKYSIRFLEDVERIGNVCGSFPQLANFLLQNRWTSSIFKKLGGIHQGRIFPRIPGENFPKWVKKRRFNTGPKRSPQQKVVFFAGCTGRYFFPEVPQATVEIFQHNGIDVYYPEQKCCGMPTLLEGDRQKTLLFAGFNIDRLFEVVKDGYDIVCSCPTCGYMLKEVLKEGAYYSPEYQASVSADDVHLKIPKNISGINPKGNQFVLLKKSMYEGILKDAGYFSSIDPRKRILVAENTYDLGEYLRNLHRSGDLKKTFSPINEQIAYYPPCHLREQEIGRPYMDLFGLIPGIGLAPIEGDFHCCGMGGIMGFKREFHKTSLRMGSRLIGKIKAIHPEIIATDCMSCRLQFSLLTPYRVLHPVEVLKKSYTAP